MVLELSKEECEEMNVFFALFISREENEEDLQLPAQNSKLATTCRLSKLLKFSPSAALTTFDKKHFTACPDSSHYASL